MPCLLQILGDQTLDRRIKLPALRALGDLSIYCPTRFNEEFLLKTLEVLGHAARAATTTQVQPDDKDTIKFLGDLREEIIDQYCSVIMSAQDSQHLAVFDKFLVEIF